MSPLDAIDAARPCPGTFSELQGTERARTCGRCGQRVYALTGLSEAEALTLLTAKEGPNVALYRRPDGTVQTGECRGGFAGARAGWLAVLAALLVAAVFAVLAFRANLNELREASAAADAIKLAPDAKRVAPASDGSERR